VGSYAAFLYLSVLICKIEIIVPTFVRHLEQCLAYMNTINVLAIILVIVNHLLGIWDIIMT
jgi:hypothetical protein